jgi:50S ribosomal protein L16 3-hydroxylase
MLSRWTDAVLPQLTDNEFFCDPGREPAARAGEIANTDIQRALQQLRSAQAHEIEHDWFGELVTEPRYEIEADEGDIAAAKALLARGVRAITPSPGSKLAWIESSGHISVFANGQTMRCEQRVLPCLLVLCQGVELTGSNLDKALADPDTMMLLEQLIDSRCIHVR